MKVYLKQKEKPMRMEKRKFRIGELAKRLKLERFVVRFWEKEFGLKTARSVGKQRFYSEEDFSKFERIKQLLYQEGFTIAGAKQQLVLERNSKPAQIIPSSKTTMDLTLIAQKEEQIS